MLAGWAFDVPTLQRLHPSLVSMKANTALAFLLAGIALWLRNVRQGSSTAQRVATACAAAVMILGILSLSEGLFSTDFGIDQLLFKDNASSQAPGRMSPATAMNFVIVGISLLLLDVPILGGLWPAQGLAVASGLLSLVAILGYLYGVRALYAVTPFATVALHTALSFFALSLGLLLSRPDRPLMERLTSETSAGVIMRRLLPAAVVVPAAVGWLRLLGQRAGLYGTEFGLAIFALSNIVLLGGLIWWTSGSLFRTETQRIEALQALAQSERSLGITLDSIGDAVIATDTTGCVTRMNRMAQKLTGWPLQEARHRRLEEVFHIINQDTRQPAENPVERVLREGVVVGLANHTVLVSREGTESAIDDTGAPIRDDEGILQGVVLVFHDVTAERAAANALRRSEARFARLLKAGILGIVVSDTSGNIKEANDTFLKMLGYSRRDLDSGNVLGAKLTPPEWAAANRLSMEQLNATGVAPAWEKELFRKDGSRVPVIIGVAALDPPECVSFMIDISERKRLEEVRQSSIELEAQNARIKEANRLKSEFLANMSHELRTPLNAILGFGEMLRDGIVKPEEPQYREFLGDIVTSGRHLLQLINDVLDLAKVEAGKLDFRPEPVDLEPLIRETIAVVSAIAKSKMIRTVVTVDSALSSAIVLDPARLKQIIYNFLSNALKFTPQRGQVEVRALQEGSESFRIEVEDTGPGIAPEDISKLFIEFQQLDAGAGKQHGGTGLGLALTRRLAEAQGGTVGVRSTPGRGSVFHVVLPRRSPIGRAPVRPPPRPGAPTVLVIEDEAQDHALLVQALSGAGYAVEVADNGTQALALCAQRSFAAITLDLLLPDMSGQEVLRRIRASGENRDVPVVVVTVVTERGAVAGLTVNDFLTKPIEIDSLLHSLRRAGVAPEHPGNVLVVDDDPSSLKLMGAALAQIGYRATCIADPEEALRLSERATPSAVVLDLLMPSMNGFEFLERFRSNPANAPVPVLIWTIKDVDAVERARLSKAAQGILRKGERGVSSLMEDLRRFLASTPSSQKET